MMKIPLSKRLSACCSYIHPGDRVADVGCDHGYLGIYLLKNEIASSVIASDLREGPLHHAVHNAARFHLQDKISFYLSNGVRSIPRDFDTLVCAGMGGDTMVSILSAAPWLKAEQYRLILQCQTKSAILRRYLSENGWAITDESVLLDGKFFYTVMEVLYRPGCTLTPGQWYIPPALLKHPSNETAAYILWIRRGLRNIVSSRGENVDPALKSALYELESLKTRYHLTWLKEESF